MRDGAQQVADEVVEFGVEDQVRGLLVEQRSAEHAGQAEQRVAAAGQAIGLAVGADQLTLNAECGGLQRDKVDVFESIAVDRLAKHDDPSSLLSQCNEGYRESAERKSDGGGSGVWKTRAEMRECRRARRLCAGD